MDRSGIFKIGQGTIRLNNPFDTFRRRNKKKDGDEANQNNPIEIPMVEHSNQSQQQQQQKPIEEKPPISGYTVEQNIKLIFDLYQTPEDRSQRIVRWINSVPSTDVEILQALPKGPTRDAVVVAVRRRDFLGVLLHAITVLFFLASVTLQHSVTNGFMMSQAIESALVTSQDANGNTFMDIDSWEDLANYLQVTLVPTFSKNVSYSGAPFDEEQSKYLNYDNRIVGAVRFRQQRVTDHSCKLSTQAKTITNVCYSSIYDSETKDTSPFGPPDDPTRYVYQSHTDTGNSNAVGYSGKVYKGGGYITDIPLDSNFSSAVNTLIQDEWWGRGTRVIIITANFFNVELDNRAAVLNLVLEMNPAGVVQPWYQIKTYRLDLYFTKLDFIRFALEIIFLILYIAEVFLWLYQFRLELYSKGKFVFKAFLTHWYDPWSVVTLFYLGLLTTVIIMYLYFYSLEGKDFSLNSTSYIPELERFSSVALDYFNVAAVTILVCALRTFKFLTHNNKLFVMWAVLHKARVDLIGLAITFFVLMLGFMISDILFVLILSLLFYFLSP
eukprot:TRINITY_DN8356_c0_g2_i1.p1 TRINITY_DN8356_c0_g2~~TRINITY_DN8356_c0_g2_i1.p1  ORF type:complete len:553 (-),score=79.96 TRINITY_DN8356_c0_g2_i1:800-2458(-)